MTPRQRLDTGKDSSSSPPSPDRTESSTAQHETVLAKGPTESSDCDSGTAPLLETRVDVGLKPIMPQKAAGMRHDPPVSVPMVAVVMPSATLTAPPEVDPPGMRLAARS